MDAKITRKRLGIALSYDWLKILAVIAAAITAWMFLFKLSAVRLKCGQTFYIHTYGTSFKYDQSNAFMSKLNKSLSYDVLETGLYTIPNKSGANESILAKDRIREGDIMIVDDIDTGTADKPNYDSLAKKCIDYFRFYALDDLAKDCGEYLSRFFDESGEMKHIVVEESFRARMKKDNRFRTEKQILKGVAQEKARLATLKSNYEWLVGELEADRWRPVEQKYFFTYNKMEQAAGEEPDKNHTVDQTARPYALRLEALPGASEFVRNDQGNCKGIMVLVYDYHKFQPDLQYETIAALRCIVETYGAAA